MLPVNKTIGCSGVVTATGSVGIEVESLTGDVEARVSAGSGGTQVPVNAAGHVRINSLAPHAIVVVKVDGIALDKVLGRLLFHLYCAF